MPIECWIELVFSCFDYDEVLNQNQMLKPSGSLVFVSIDEMRSEQSSPCDQTA